MKKEQLDNSLLRRAFLPTLPFLLLCLWACPPPEASETEASADASSALSDEENLRALNETVALFAQTTRDEDVEAFVDLFTEDAIRLPPESEPIQGHDAIRNATTNQFLNSDSEITIHLLETEFSGDLAFVRGTFAVTSTFTDGTSGDLVGSWMNLMTRGDDGRWRISRNMWNRDQPIE